MSAHLIVTVHGIRTFGQWQERLEKLVGASGAQTAAVDFINYKYGYFSVLGFIIPIFRWLVVKRFRKTLVELCNERRWDRIDLVSHSFGTHVIAWALAGLPIESSIQVHTVILSGSVLKGDFPWRDLLRRRVRRVVNDCGTKDGILLLSQFAVLFTGMAGRIGFSGATSKVLRNRYSAFGHSGYFLDSFGHPSDEYMRAEWLPLLQGEGEIRDFDCRTAGALEGFVTFLANNTEPIKICIYVAPFALLSSWIYSLYVDANHQRILAEQALARATRSSNELVFEIAQRFESQKGVPQDLIVALLKKAEALVDGLAETGSVNFETERALGAALVELSARSLEQGRADEALRSASRAIQLFEQLDHSSSLKIETKSDLAVAYDRKGDALLQAGNKDAALAAYKAFNHLAQEVTQNADTSGHTSAKDLLAVSDEKLGSLVGETDPEAGLKFYLECLRLRTVAAEETPSSQAQRDLGITLSRLADLQLLAGQADAAIRSYNEALSALEKSTRASPDNTQYMRDAAVTNERLGDALKTQGFLSEALQHYEADLEIMVQLVRSDGGHEGWKRDILKSYFRVGDALAGLGELQRAKTSYADGLQAALAFGESTPSADWRSISAFYQRLCETYARLGDSEMARTKAAEGSRFFEQFAHSNPAQRARFAQSINREAWYAILANDFEAALVFSDKAIATLPDAVELRPNKIHALIFAKRLKEASDAFSQAQQLFRKARPQLAELLDQDLEDLKGFRFSGELIAAEAKLIREWKLVSTVETPQ